MVSLDDAVVAKYKTHGHNFEVYVDPDKALDYRGGEEVDVTEILAVENVFKDASAADKASTEVMTEVFNTENILEVAAQVIKKGELHLTTEQKKRIHEERKKQVVSLIARNAINPQTNTPHPPARIERAMEEARVNIEIGKTAKSQVEGVLKALKPIMPIKFAKARIAVKIPAKYGGKFHNIFTEYGELKKDEWVGDSEFCLVEIPAGMQDEFASKLNGLTHGEAEIKIVREKNGS